MKVSENLLKDIKSSGIEQVIVKKPEMHVTNITKFIKRKN